MGRGALIDLATAGRRALAGALDLLVPRACALCARLLHGTEPDLVCGACWLAARELPRPRCDRCGHPCATGPTSMLMATGRASLLMATGPASLLMADRPTSMLVAGGVTAARLPAGRVGVSPIAVPSIAHCRWCELLPPYVRSARSAYAIPGGSAASLVYALKYAGWPAVARGMARRMAALRFPPDVERERAGLVPVPLAAGRQRERGYNQSHELARWLGAHWGLPVHDSLLQRTRATRSQTRLTPGERSRNVAGAFRAHADRAALRGLHLVLVDDVVTTAATLNACAAALHDGGARILSFVTFGRAPAVGDRW